VAALCSGELSVSGIAGELGLKQCIVSQQLRILRMSGLVRAARRGGFARYSLAEPRLRTLVGCLGKCNRGHTLA
jgi:DNA-binding transcriptional ArsR family regulator